jgi:hypothetical protein
MAKVSIGLRGWRFDEETVFDAEGNLRSLEEIPPETRQRLARLTAVIGEPCDACWLIHGAENRRECNPARVVYGEPMGEVVVCDDHEADFVYWFREESGADFAGTTAMRDAFHEWFADGGRAPEDYAGIEHVDEEPDALPEAPDTSEGIPSLEEELDQMDEEEREALDLDLDDLDL